MTRASSPIPAATANARGKPTVSAWSSMDAGTGEPGYVAVAAYAT
ncbi:hypothetical protein [Catenulispora sp. EB89]